MIPSVPVIPNSDGGLLVLLPLTLYHQQSGDYYCSVVFLAVKNYRSYTLNPKPLWHPHSN